MVPISRLALGTILVTLTASLSTAQSLSFGVKAGVSLATIHVDSGSSGSGPSQGYRIGLAAGGFVAWSFAERLELQPEVLFSQKGSTIDDVAAMVETKIDAIDVPVLAKYRITGTRERNVHVFGGPTFGFQLRGKTAVDVAGDSFERDIGDELKQSDIGLTAGAGLQFGPLSVDGRYTWGLTGIDELADDETKVTHRVISVLAGFRF